jgi:predicted kinase
MVVYILVGPPCSGKSTAAKQLCVEDPNIIRVNRDELRIMLKGRYTVGNRLVEACTTNIVRHTIDTVLRSGNDLVVDATHCKMKYIQDILEMIPTDVDCVVKYILFDVPYWKQRWRNFWRWVKTGIWIPSNVSKAMDKNFKEVKKQLSTERAYLRG